MVKASDSRDSGCDCKGGSNNKKDNGSSKNSNSTSGFRKTPCEKPQSKNEKAEAKCHESHEKFKQKTDGTGNGKDEGKCNSSYSEGLGQDAGGRQGNDCSNAYGKFMKNTREEECPDSHGVAEKECSPEEPGIKNCPCPRSVDKMSDIRDLDCTSDTEPLEKKSCTNSKNISTAPPCPPSMEEGVQDPPGCTKKVTCPQAEKVSWAEFFPIDVRNKKLKECIEKFSKVDPSQVVSRCSQFATAPQDNSEKCLKQEQKTQQGCTQSGKSSGAGKNFGAGKKTSALISPNYRTLIRRWSPSAGVYLAASAATFLYVTEWKAVMKYVPLWKDVVMEEGGSS